MKKIISALAVLGLAVSGFAQGVPVYSSQTLGTFIVAGSTASNLNYVIDCRKQQNVAVQIDNRLSGSGTDAQNIVFSRSVDGINYSTTLQTVTITPVASTASTVVTNIPANGAGYIKINYYTNAAASATSTNTIKFGVKIQAP